MKILINTLSAKLGGGQIYIVNFLKNLPADCQHEIILLCGVFNEQKFRAAGQGTQVHFVVKGKAWRNSLFRTLWELLVLPFYLKHQHIQLYFQPAAGVPIYVPKNCRSATMLRNMLPFEDRERQRFPWCSMVRLKMILQKRLILFSLDHFDRVIFISKYSQQFITRFLPNIERKSQVIPHGLNEHFLHDCGKFDITQFGLRAWNYYLYVSILDYYKAQLEVIREWKKLVDSGFKFPLVLTGFLNRTAYVDSVKSEIKRLHLEQSVILTGPIENKFLPGFYRQARALIFASSCECCPNILLEKMAAGKPLFCSNIQPMPEFGGDAVFYFDPYREGSLAEVINQAENTPGDMHKKALLMQKNAQQYKWSQTISKTLAYITG